MEKTPGAARPKRETILTPCSARVPFRYAICEREINTRCVCEFPRLFSSLLFFSFLSAGGLHWEGSSVIWRRGSGGLLVCISLQHSTFASGGDRDTAPQHSARGVEWDSDSRACWATCPGCSRLELPLCIESDGDNVCGVGQSRQCS